MKTKILVATATLMMLTLSVIASGKDETYNTGYQYGTQGVVVNNYYYDNGYEFASRINRFHRSYVSFDFYSPMYTETYWYNYVPYTWGVSIYDDWYYYGSGISRYSWRSGFGGSYWWGYDPFLDYDPWMGYGWSSWYNPGISFSVNIYLGRPQYHYPVAWNRWHSHDRWTDYRPVYIVNNNYYSTHNTYNNNVSRPGRDYNPSNPYDADHRRGYMPGNSGGRGSSSTYTRPDVAGRGQRTEPGSGREGNAPENNNGRGDRGNQGNNGQTNNNQGNSNQGNNANQGNNGRDHSDNGLHMGQYRRGTQDSTGMRTNAPARPNNPNVNDRTNPGRENTGNKSQAGQVTPTGRPARTQTGQNTQVRTGRTVSEEAAQPSRSSATRSTQQSNTRQQTQGSVRTTSQRKETTVRQGSSSSSRSSSSKPAGSKSDTGKSGESKSSKNNSERNRSESGSRR